MELSERLTALLKEKGWTYYRLAKLACMPTTTVEQLVKGKRKSTSHENMQKLASAFNISVDELIGSTMPEIIPLNEPYIEIAKIAQHKKIDPDKLKALIDVLSKE